MSAISVGNFNNKHVRVVFTNGMTCEGRVILWEDGRSVLIDEDSGSLLYIYNTKDNVMLVKVAAEEEIQIDLNGSIDLSIGSGDPVVEAVDYKRKFADRIDDFESVPIRDHRATVRAPATVTPYSEPPAPKLDYHEPDPNLRLKKLAELKRLRNRAMKDTFTNRLRTFTPTTEIMPDYYAAPNFKK